MEDPGAAFRIDVPQSVLDDLRGRLERTRWPRAPEGPDWALGASLPFMRKVAEHWLNAYDWRAVEAKLNRIPQRLIPLRGLATHVFIEPGSGSNPMPILLGHGWPGSPIELMALVEPLAHPERFGGDVADAFTVVVPGLPGCGFSQPPPAPVSPREIGARWGELMGEALGFERFLVHGGDWSAVIGSWMGVDRPRGMVGLHLNAATFGRPVDQLTTPLEPAEEAYVVQRAARNPAESAYQAANGHKPLSLAYAQADSPIGLAAWIIEKFHAWTVHGQPVDPPFALDDLISNVMFYWLGDAQAMSWIYRYVVDGSGARITADQSVTLPTGVCLFPDDLWTAPPDAWIRRTYNLVRSTRAAVGGHFPGLEHPQVLVEDIRAFRTLVQG